MDYTFTLFDIWDWQKYDHLEPETKLWLEDERGVLEPVISITYEAEINSATLVSNGPEPVLPQYTLGDIEKWAKEHNVADTCVLYAFMSGHADKHPFTEFAHMSQSWLEEGYCLYFGE